MLEWELWDVKLCVSIWFPVSLLLMMVLSASPIVWLCLFASAVHECGHAVAMWAVRDRPKYIAIGVFGIRIERSAGFCLGYREACAVSLAGPLVNLMAAMLFWFFRCPEASAVNTGLALFNLLPISSLDGGEALYAVCCQRWSAETARRITRAVSLCVLLPLAVAGFWLLLAERGNFTLLFMCAYLIFLFLFKEKD